jgi:hypothetical protein
MPIPRLQFGLYQFTQIPFTQGWLAVQGFYADGLFENTRPITSRLKLHQKALYLRLHKPGSSIKLYGGINHQVQWGGKSPYFSIQGQMPNRFKDYLRVIFGDPFTSAPDSVYTDFDAARVGNHLGSVDVGLEVDKANTTWLFYRQSIYDDGSLFRLKNIRDGLNGISFRRKKANSAYLSITGGALELLYTKHQGGPTFSMDDRIFGRDNYFNNAQVRDGWSYYDRTIGTPFIPPTSDTTPQWPGFQFTSNNRVAVLHLGLQGTWLQSWEWSTRLSYSSNEGSYDLPFSAAPTQFSGLLTLQHKTNWLGSHTTLKASLAVDRGELYKNSTGVMLSLRKDGLF